MTTKYFSCLHEKQCQARCHKEFDILSSGGDLFAISKDGERTNGQVLCDHLKKKVMNEYVSI